MIVPRTRPASEFQETLSPTLNLCIMEPAFERPGIVNTQTPPLAESWAG